MDTTLLPNGDFESLRDQAIALRRQGFSRRVIRDRLRIYNNDLLNRLLEGEQAPEWTKRPNAKDDLRDEARRLRSRGLTYDQIQMQLGCSKSSISLWVRDLPKPDRGRSRGEATEIARRGWEARLRIREEERQRTKAAARLAIGELSDRELFLVGVALYWAEGSKDKPYSRREAVIFVNSDPNMIELYLRWLDLLGVERTRLRFHVMIHESADLPTAQRFWGELTGADAPSFCKPNIKKHNPRTVRKNTGDGYHGCLAIRVLQGADLYRRIEGAWYGIVDAARTSGAQSRT
ncbi:hypothetical protein [Streptomyces sp. CO7]